MISRTGSRFSYPSFNPIALSMLLKPEVLLLLPSTRGAYVFHTQTGSDVRSLNTHYGSHCCCFAVTASSPESSPLFLVFPFILLLPNPTLNDTNEGNRCTESCNRNHRLHEKPADGSAEGWFVFSLLSFPLMIPAFVSVVAFPLEIDWLEVTRRNER